ncbi:MAG TPA: PQQ-dependent sugar dehydrogenase [Pyrinomonadaceae bacterium]|nr:PQQ-dependent sugar dehydrogenase [Pyrinomonadaceae bacterium]
MSSTRTLAPFITAALLFFLGTAWACTAEAATLPAGFSETRVAAGLPEATAMAFAPDGRIFVCLQGGQLRVVQNDALLATPFLTVPVDSSSERGLLGVAFDPNFSTNRFVYIYYTLTTTPRRNRVSRFTANGNVAVPGSEVVILELDNLSAGNHNGGAMHFGPDGKLYIATGENAVASNSQTLSNLLGKVLRINPDGTVPTDNPFFNQAVGKNRAIWALGLRNPFTFAFQTGTGRMFVNDVGANTWEEINEGARGANYGWPETEGPTTDSRFRSPVYAYRHDAGRVRGCAVTGGAFYNPAVNQFPGSYVGRYFFADICGGWVMSLDPSAPASDTNPAPFAEGVAGPVDLKVGPDGSLYYLARFEGALYKVRFTAQQPPSVVTQPSSQTVAPGQTATFSVSASGTQPLAYRWERSDNPSCGASPGPFNPVAGANAPSLTVGPVTAADNCSRFRAVVSNAFGSVTSDAAALNVTTNSAPTAVINAPAEGSLYRAGQRISYSGSATDPEDGALPASAFLWRVDFHHEMHTHPFVPPTAGRTAGSFTVPTTGETSADVWFRIHLTVTDSAGLKHSTSRDVLPLKSTMTFLTSPPGLALTLDGQPLSAPASVEGVAGMRRTLGVVSPQRVDGVTYEFDSWSDGGAATHDITTPDADTTYTANFVVKQTPTPLLRFSPARYTVSEGGRSVRLTVIRGGDRSAAVAVDYATADGTASERSDYTTALGTLRFGPGETSKSFVVLLTDDATREGTERFNVALSNPTGGAALDAPAAALVNVGDNDAVTSSENPVDNARFFVRQHYLDFLGREPDAAGLDFWSSGIEACGADAACRDGRRVDTSAAFFLSIEFQETGYLAYRFYRASLGRFPRFREFIRDSQEIGRGVRVGIGDWEGLLESNKRDFAERWVTRPEFKARFDALTDAQYVDALFRAVGVTPTPAERRALLDGLATGAETRATVLRKIAEREEFARAEFRPAFVLMQYFGYLRRSPDDPPDTDFGGFDFWLKKLNDNGGDYRRAEMVRAFIVSIEYRRRFGQ